MTDQQDFLAFWGAAVCGVLIGIILTYGFMKIAAMTEATVFAPAHLIPTNIHIVSVSPSPQVI